MATSRRSPVLDERSVPPRRRTRALGAFVPGLSLGLAGLLAGCGGASLDGPEWTVARPRPVPPSSPAVALGTVALHDVTSGARLLVLAGDGTIEGTACARRLETDGRLLRARGGPLRVVGDEVLDARGEVRFALTEGSLVRPDGVAASREGDVITLPEGELSVRVEHADDPALARTALVLVAALAACE